MCDRCRRRLVVIEPMNTIHCTESGPFYSRITMLNSQTYWGHHWGCDIEGGNTFGSVAAARHYLVDSFLKMFPEHVCSDACGSTTELHVGHLCHNADKAEPL